MPKTTARLARIPRNTANDKVRVNQIQRENAVSALRDASADGRLSFDELNERVAAAFTAIARGDLVRLLDDLVADEDLDAVIADPGVQDQGPGFRWDEPLVIRPGDKSITTEGRWAIPPFLEILVGADSVRLDCLEAIALAPIIDIAIVADGWGGSPPHRAAWPHLGPREGPPRWLLGPASSPEAAPEPPRVDHWALSGAAQRRVSG